MMSVSVRVVVMVTLFVCFFSISAFASERQDVKDFRSKLFVGKKLYTAFNMWHENKRISTVNYQNGVLLPVGTEVKTVFIESSFYEQRIRYDVGTATESKKDISSRSDMVFTKFYFKTKDGSKYSLDYDNDYSPNTSRLQFAAKMLTTKSLEERVEGLSDDDKLAIMQGAVIEGMTKENVVMALGYPPEHRTPNYETSFSWIYWLDGRRMKKYCFDLYGGAVNCNAIGNRKPL